jgi:ribosomal protein S18 acetylase RimI-like enzyme
MAGLKLLLDTNILIALEDNRPLSADLASLSEKAQLHGLTLFVDEAVDRDVARDRDPERRERTLTKIRRFPRIEGVAHSDANTLEARFGSAKDDNDSCDILLLDTVFLGVVDFLISEDIGLHRRAIRSALGDRVFRIVDALSWIRRTFEPREFPLPFVVARKAHQISLSDPIFESLREDYRDFDCWYEKRCRREHRDCWVVEIGNRIAGLAIRKDEGRGEAQILSDGERILKICTFKVSPEYRGEKLGEHLLKKVLWFAQANRYDVVYLTAYPKHEFLVALLQQFGFQATIKTEIGELVLERVMHHAPVLEISPAEMPLAVDFATYPRYYSGARVAKFAVPIQPQFHISLFPEIAEATPLPLFPSARYAVGPDSGTYRTPGNTIRKVYVCRAATRQLSAGDILLFYLSKSMDLVRSQSITSVGIVERTQLANSAPKLLRAVGRRSVYSQIDLVAMNPRSASPVLVIDFILIGHLHPPISVPKLCEVGVFAGRPPQSIARIGESAFQRLRDLLRVEYA